MDFIYMNHYYLITMQHHTNSEPPTEMAAAGVDTGIGTPSQPIHWASNNGKQLTIR